MIVFSRIIEVIFCTQCINVSLCICPVPPLEGFVMNRVLGDYFETLLYKIFVSIDEHTKVAEVRQCVHDLHILAQCTLYVLMENYG